MTAIPRLALLACAGSALVAGLGAGLARLGWDMPQGAALAALHGPLLICGVFGTLISLERAVALARPWAFLGPCASASGTLALLAGLPPQAAGWGFVLAAITLCFASARTVQLQPAAFTASLAVGALAWLFGSILWALGATVPDLVGWWLAFLVLTVAGERLELSRLTVQRRGGLPLYIAACALILAGAAARLTEPTGTALMGGGLLMLTGWLVRHDIAAHTIRSVGQARFMAACMLAGYAWLGLAGLAFLALPPTGTAFGYDIALHAVLIGFVLSMVFGHAPIILPAVARIPVRYGPVLYGPLFLLHASVALRVCADLAGWYPGRRWSGVMTVTALLAYLLCVAASKRSSLRPRPPAGQGAS
ncbi:hypothetical protein ACRAWG_14760 [Methylobacterium sp. P31]